MTDHYDVFLSYSRNDLEAAAALRDQLSRHGLSVFKDDSEAVWNLRDNSRHCLSRATK